MNKAQNIIHFMQYAEALKTELRKASKSNGDRESVAEHCWSLCLLLLLVAPYLSVDVDLLKTLKMAIIHDLVEIEAKDISILEHLTSKENTAKKFDQETQAIHHIREMLEGEGQTIYQLWIEFEELKTNEAKLLKVLDRIEGQLQFLNETVTVFEDREQPIIDHLLRDTIELTRLDPFLSEIYNLLLDPLRERIRA